MTLKRIEEQCGRCDRVKAERRVVCYWGCPHNLCEECAKFTEAEREKGLAEDAKARAEGLGG